LNLSKRHPSKTIARIVYGIFTHESECTRGLKFSCRIETERLRKITGSRLWAVKAVFSWKSAK